MNAMFSCLFVLRILLLIAGDVEENPGPVFTINNIAYEEKQITGDGACAFRSLSFVLCGNEGRFEDVIQDCISVFRHCPTVYYNGVTFAEQDDERGQIEAYERFMTDCIRQLQSGRVLYERLFWGEGGHFEAISLLYDVRIYVFSDATKQWEVFNQDGNAGYVCLLSAHNHISVLHGVEVFIVPTQPNLANITGRTRHDVNWTACGVAQGKFSAPFPFVWSLHQAVPHAQAVLVTNKTLNNKQEKEVNVCQLCAKQFKTVGDFAQTS
jgi:hypothetical protein